MVKKKGKSSLYVENVSRRPLRKFLLDIFPFTAKVLIRSFKRNETTSSSHNPRTSDLFAKGIREQGPILKLF